MIWLELAQALELKAEGISFPGHFLVKVTLPEGLVVLDPLTGDSLGLDNLAERLAPFRQHLGDASDMEAPLGLYLQAAPPRDILTRMLRNLKEIFNSQEDWQRLIKVQDRLLVLHPDALAENEIVDWHSLNWGRTKRRVTICCNTCWRSPMPVTCLKFRGDWPRFKFEELRSLAYLTTT